MPDAADVVAKNSILEYESDPLGPIPEHWKLEPEYVLAKAVLRQAAEIEQWRTDHRDIAKLLDARDRMILARLPTDPGTGEPLHGGRSATLHMLDMFKKGDGQAAEIELLKGAMAAEDERLRLAAERVGVTWVGCDTADAMADEDERLREALEDSNSWLATFVGHEENDLGQVSQQIADNAAALTAKPETEKSDE